MGRRAGSRRGHRHRPLGVALVIGLWAAGRGAGRVPCFAASVALLGAFTAIHARNMLIS